ncbi:hypothetical protein OIU79_001885 [Salix purpurea]|uniref:Uncharacterized protein n=1 Tax=Salix purpurea TaxID=77065 RepID=A0A9Q0URD9_SALPP|nr:hypothetical protein OIU79_001885 [Salix purpurea]
MEGENDTIITSVVREEEVVTRGEETGIGGCCCWSCWTDMQTLTKEDKRQVIASLKLWLLAEDEEVGVVSGGEE